MSEPRTQSVKTKKNLSKAERRRSWRYGCSGPAFTRLYLPDRDEILYAWLYDISLNGISLDLLTPLESGQQLLVQVKHGSAERTELTVEVVHAAPASGFCRIGCRFAEPLVPEFFRAIVQHLRGEGASPDAD